MLSSYLPTYDIQHAKKFKSRHYIEVNLEKCMQTLHINNNYLINKLKFIRICYFIPTDSFQCQSISFLYDGINSTLNHFCVLGVMLELYILRFRLLKSTKRLQCWNIHEFSSLKLKIYNENKENFVEFRVQLSAILLSVKFLNLPTLRQ